jgi:hypothetical protein
VRNQLTRMLFVLAAALALWAVPSTAGAHAGNNDPTLLHVCIGNVNKVVRSVGVTGACLMGETADHWRKEGEKGEKGDKGDPGTSGINGIDGTSVTFVGNFTGSQNGCPNGGAIYAAGNPPVNTFICNGTNGIDGRGGARADGPCFDPFNRYVDCGNGTVTDSVTGLIWLKQSDCLPAAEWLAANHAAAGLKDGDCGLTDNSSPGDWRLPTQAEWRATMAQAFAWTCYVEGRGGPPSLTNDAGTGCYGDGSPASITGVASSLYWSSGTVEALPFAAWVAHLGFGTAEIAHPKALTAIAALLVWPVRGGTR